MTLTLRLAARSAITCLFVFAQATMWSFLFATMLGSIGAGRLAAGLVELAVDGPARLVWLTST